MFDKLESLLTANNTNLHQVSVKTNIPYSCLADWKSGKSKPKADKLKKIADLFGVGIDYFL